MKMKKNGLSRKKLKLSMKMKHCRKRIKDKSKVRKATDA